MTGKLIQVNLREFKARTNHSAALPHIVIIAHLAMIFVWDATYDCLMMIDFFHDRHKFLWANAPKMMVAKSVETQEIR